MRAFESCIGVFLVLLTAVGSGCGGHDAQPRSVQQATAFLASQYLNPLQIRTPDGGLVESCPDPSIIRGQQADDQNWYVYCTNEQFMNGGSVHLIPILRSSDLVNWTWVGDVFAQMPSWVKPGAGLWAPDIQFINGKYYLYYAVSETSGDSGSAIFVATSNSPLGPWMANPVPVVESMPNRTVIDPAVVQDGNQRYIFFGTFQGGIAVRQLSPDGLSSDPASQVQITTADRYEASYVIRHDGYFYLMVSSGPCCNGALSGYGISVGRSVNVLGPYIDRDGHSLMDPYVGGTPVASMNGNRWLGPGHNAVFTDAAGNDWMLYHAVDAAKPFFWGSWTRRPLMMDLLFWIDGWPRLRGGAGPSDELNSVPALSTTAHPQILQNSPQDIPEVLLASYSDEFNSAITSGQWHWLRPPADTAYGIADGALRIDTQDGVLQVERHDGSVLAEAAPVSDYLVETKLSLNVPANGYFNNVQAGLVIYGDDDNYLKLVSVAINETRQLEFGKQMTPVIEGEPAYGSAFLASAEPVVYLRIVKRTNAGFSGSDAYTAYSSHDGVNWERGATWTHSPGSAPKIGLVSMGGAGYSAFFDYVRVYTLAR